MNASIRAYPAKVTTVTGHRREESRSCQNIRSNIERNSRNKNLRFTPRKAEFAFEIWFIRKFGSCLPWVHIVPAQGVEGTKPAVRAAGKKFTSA